MAALASGDIDRDDAVETQHSQESNVSHPTTATILLSVLRCPKSSDLARKRSVDRNPPNGKKRSRLSRGDGASEPKSVNPHDRVKEFPNQSLTVSNKKLFCLACREELSLKRSVLRGHLQSSKHKSGKERLAGKKIRDTDIAEALQASDASEHLKGETLPQAQRVYRVKVVRTFLRAGVPLNKIADFRELLEESASRLTDRRHMSDLVPFVLTQERAVIKEEIGGKPLSIIFDGTCRLGEAMTIVARFISPDWSIQQRLIRFQLRAKSLAGEEIARC